MELKKLGIAFVVLLLLLAGGTALFHYVEQWSWVDSFYFTGVTITTVGYGDLTPTKSVSKIFVVFFSMIAIGIFLYYISIISDSVIRHSKIEEHIDTVIKQKRKITERIRTQRQGMRQSLLNNNILNNLGKKKKKA
ncbi:hypothetical protein COV16_01325 [Candidatus Woesearchaeota archaeon CG10_big_fil_rev_8_21_14_0_10_34_8]|nr:MAG: hypothetical protein COV16_01325 [Candidatus Woesearchaeota archaeon CG10_big_fil_rev_8_21_14_0_10_34_8]